MFKVFGQSSSLHVDFLCSPGDAEDGEDNSIPYEPNGAADIRRCRQILHRLTRVIGSRGVVTGPNPTLEGLVLLGTWLGVLGA